MRADRHIVVFLSVLSLGVRPASPQEKEPAAIATRSRTPVIIQRLSRPVAFDGLSDEEAWRDIQILPMVMMTPNFGFPPSERTEVLVGFDDDHQDEEEGISRVIPIYGGVRLIGHAGPWDLGFMDMQTASLAEEGVPGENFGVVRLRRRVLNPYSYIGTMITSRVVRDGSYNEAYGIDGILRVTGDNYLSFGWAQTFENGKQNKPLSLDPARFRVAYERRTQKGLGATIDLSRAGKDYVPGMGLR